MAVEIFRLVDIRRMLENKRICIYNKGRVFFQEGYRYIPGFDKKRQNDANMMQK